MSTGKPDFVFKVMVLGESSVGKTAFVTRLTEGMFQESYVATIGVDFKVRTTSIGGKTVQLQLWDTAGQERFRSVSKSFCRTAHGIVIIYDITNEKSFEHVPDWLEFGDADLFRLLIGAKSDLQADRLVSTAQGKDVGDQLCIPFMEISAKDGTNIEEAFLLMATEAKKLAEAQMGVVGNSSETVDVDPDGGDQSPTTGSCCHST